ncbi:MAG: hypothetical protein EBU01_16695 [Crocinitomicaceae bacterium]|nr:hypothetical protein [Crocinitomicaceae bacterium]
MATTTKVLFRGAATTSTGTTLYTVPASTTTVVSNIAVTNTAASAGTFTLALAGTAVHTTTAIAANTTVYIDLKQVLVATNTITGGASATTINFHISGVEIA